MHEIRGELYSCASTLMAFCTSEEVGISLVDLDIDMVNIININILIYVICLYIYIYIHIVDVVS